MNPYSNAVAALVLSADPGNSLALAALIVSVVINLLTFAFFLGFYFGAFREFKRNTERDLEDLKSVFFTQSKTPPRHSRAKAAIPGESFK